jgi:tRNA modification GTPase
MIQQDTIIALATPSGRGGLGVLRLSGPEAWAVARGVLKRSGKKAAAEEESETPDWPPEPWRVRMAELADDGGETIDRVLVTFFRGPRSYSAEDTVEISCHGSPVVVQYLIGRCLKGGARLAEPGEFTQRAFLNGRIDLTQAEAVRDFIDARTLYQAKVAAQQMDGSVAHWVAPLKKHLVDLIALLEAGIDFAEDDVSVLSGERIRVALEAVMDPLARMRDSFLGGRILQNGLTLAVVGRPNVGKSSLFNCLVKQDRAIVTAAVGTTRDLVAETVEIEGIPLRFLDTAGVRQASDEAESIGVRKALEAAADSDLILMVLDGSEPLMDEDCHLLERLLPQGKLLLAVNKSDLEQRLPVEKLKKLCNGEAGAEERIPSLSEMLPEVPVIPVSATQRRGIDDLRRLILQTAAPSLDGGRELQMLTNVRQARMVTESLVALGRAGDGVGEELPHEMLLIDLYNGLRPLDALTGETTVEDILTNIFSNFCIGK